QTKEHQWYVFNHLLDAVGRLDMMLSETEPKDPEDGALWRELWQQLAWLDLRPHFQEEVMSERPRAAILKLTALLHDIAKPQTKTLDENGRIRFLGHDKVGADVAADILRRLRFSSRELEMVRVMIVNHLRPVQLGQEGPPSRRALYRYYRDCGEAAIELLFLSMADHLATVGSRVKIEHWRGHVSLVNYILAKRYEEVEIVAPPKLVSGLDIMTELGLSPGPTIGQLLEAIREAQAAGVVYDRDGAIALARRELMHLGLAASTEEET
ncbi:MAG: HD domain-containing protein, partial [Dehalococcoidia bacterium]